MLIVIFPAYIVLGVPKFIRTKKLSISNFFWIRLHDHTDKNELALSVVLKELRSIYLYLQWSHPFYTKFVPSPIQIFNSSLHLPSLLNHHWSIKNTGCWVAKSLSNDSWEMENKFSQFTMGKDEWPRSLRWALT